MTTSDHQACFGVYDSFLSPVAIVGKEKLINYSNKAFTELFGGRSALSGVDDTHIGISDLLGSDADAELWRIVENDDSRQIIIRQVTVSLGLRNSLKFTVVVQKIEIESEDLCILQFISEDGVYISNREMVDSEVNINQLDRKQERQLSVWVSIDKDGIFDLDFTNKLIPLGDFLLKVHPSDRYYFSEDVELGIATGNVKSGLFRIVAARHQLCHYDIHPLGSNDRALINILSVEKELNDDNDRSGSAEIFSAFDHLALGCFFTDESGKYTYGNNTWLKYIEREKREVIGSNLGEDIFEQDSDWALSLWQMSHRHNLPFEYDLRFCKCAKGRLKWISISSFSFVDNAGQYYYGAIAIDVSMRKRKEVEIQLMKDDFNSLMNATGIPMMIIDLGRRITDCNERFLELFGYGDLHDVVGKSTEVLFPTKEYFEQLGHTAIVSVINSGTYNGILQLKRSNNEIFHGEIIANILTGGTENNLRIIVSVRDVSEIMYANIEARKNELRFSQLNRAIDQALLVSVTDIHGVVTYINEAFTNTFGYTEAQIIGETHQILNSGIHSAQFFRNLWNTILSGKTWKGVIQNKLANGELHWTDTTIIPQIDDQGEIIQFIALRYDINKFFRTKYKSLMKSGGRQAETLIHSLTQNSFQPVIARAAKADGVHLHDESAKSASVTAELAGRLPFPYFCFVKDAVSDNWQLTELNNAAEHLISEDKDAVMYRNIPGSSNVVLESIAGLILGNQKFSEAAERRELHLQTALWEGWFDSVVVKISSNEILVALHDVSDYKRKEVRAGDQIRKLELLIRESRHRFKNSLQLLNSLSYLHRIGMNNENVGTLMMEAENRARGIAQLNDFMMRNIEAEEIEARKYTSDIIFLFERIYSNGKVKVLQSIENVSIGLKSILNYGIILNELLTNCMKHAIDDSGKLEIVISLSQAAPNLFVLKVSDNGQRTDLVESESKISAGREIIHQLVIDMNGEISRFRNETGYCVQITFTDVRS